MDRNETHGRHGGNRGSGDAREDDDPNRRKGTPAESQAGDRNENKGGQGRKG